MKYFERNMYIQHDCFFFTFIFLHGLSWLYVLVVDWYEFSQKEKNLARVACPQLFC